MDEEMSSKPYNKSMVNGSDHRLLGAIILAGGRSSRMGTDKALLYIEGKPLIRRVSERLLGLGLHSLFIAVGDKPDKAYRQALEGLFPPTPVRYVRDSYPECGPLAGLHAGLGAAEGEGFLFVIACDMPMVSETLFARIVNEAARPNFKADVVRAGEQPFHACYHTRIVNALGSRLESGELRVMGFLRELNCLVVEPTPAEQAAFVNLNTPEDYAEYTSSKEDSLPGNS